MSMRAYAGRLASHGIKVNGIAAGVINTDLSRVRIPDYEEAAEKGYIFMVRAGAPEDIAHATISAIETLRYRCSYPRCWWCDDTTIES